MKLSIYLVLLLSCCPAQAQDMFPNPNTDLSLKFATQALKITKAEAIRHSEAIKDTQLNCQTGYAYLVKENDNLHKEINELKAQVKELQGAMLYAGQAVGEAQKSARIALECQVAGTKANKEIHEAILSKMEATDQKLTSLKTYVFKAPPFIPLPAVAEKKRLFDW